MCGFKKEDSRWKRGDLYVFVDDTKGVELCHPFMPELEGTSQIDQKDVDGKRVVATTLETVSQGKGSGWVHYKWSRPGDPDKKLVWKSAYVMRVSDELGAEYIVGSGLYEMKTEKLFVVETVEAAANLVELKGKDAFPTLRDMASPYRYQEIYVFVHDGEGIELVNPAFPEREGENLLDFQDANGKFVVRDTIKMLEDKDAGWIDYMWPKPGETTQSKKSSYVRKVKAGDEVLYVGAGVYE